MSLDPAPDWLVAVPIAHRGLHDRGAGRIENSIAAARAAMAHGFAIECDVQMTSDCQAMVFHDFELDRLTGASGAMADLSRNEAELLRLAETSECVPSWAAFLDVVGGAVPIVCEIKSRFDGDMRLVETVLATAASYAGPLAIKSFDPAVLVHLRSQATRIPLGIVAEAHYRDPDWAALSETTRQTLAHALHFGQSRPDFISYHVSDLPHAVPYLCRTLLNMPVMAWTVRTPDQRQRSSAWADQMVFEGFLP